MDRIDFSRKSMEKMYGSSGQFIKLPFEVIDDPSFRNKYMKKDRFRTYVYLARRIVRGKMRSDPLNLYENYWQKNLLAAWCPTRPLSKALGIGRQTANDHINQLSEDRLIKKDVISPEHSYDRQRQVVCVLGFLENGKEYYYLCNVFGEWRGRPEN